MNMPVVLAFIVAIPALAHGAVDEIAPSPAPLVKAALSVEESPRHGPRKGLSAVRKWNQISIDASGLDHKPPGAGETRVFREQLGPGRASRAIAIVHIAIFDTMNAVTGDYQSYTGVRAPNGPLSMDIAIAQAAHDTLSALFPAQKASFDNWLAEDIASVNNRKQRADSIELGQKVAAAILSRTAHDGSEAPELVLGTGYFTSDDAGHWRQDPISLVPLALGAHWGSCTPLVIPTVEQFRAPAPPAMNSAAYTAAYNEAKRLGGDGITTPTERTPEQTHVGFFWAYDGTPSLCAPPRLYNQITMQIADQMGSDDIEVARLLVLVNVAMSDAGMACWESKFHYDVWRPITGIREADAGTGPLGIGDGNANTVGDPNFKPLGAPASNLTGPNFTPPFPAYPSGHATFGGAIFQVLRRFYGTDNIPFTFVSDEFNGVTRGNDGTARPLLPRSFTTLSQAEEENGQSRIYLGIHWSFDKTEGINMGRKIGDYVFDHAFVPSRRHGH
ncbi:MAG: hypothetical protein QOF48_3901 [Verrucomicrobiota bacterium]|jgi:hypothetical protein